MGGGGGDASGQARLQQQQSEAAVTQGLGAINKQFAGFNPKFYAQRAQDYVNYATPQLNQQVQAAQKQTAFSNARRGLQTSSANTGMRQSLAKTTATQKQGIVDAGQAQARQLQKDVEGQRSNLTNQLVASQNPAIAAQGAMQTASQFSSPSMFAPIGNMLTGWSNAFANQLSYNQNQNFSNALSQVNSPAPYSPSGSVGGGAISAPTMGLN